MNITKAYPKIGEQESKLLKANRLLSISAKLWFGVALIGIWMFGYYIIAFYGTSAIQGNLDTWGKRLVYGIVEGDLIGNLAVASHLLLAAIVCFAGPLQFIPSIRDNYPRFHRVNGRVYITTAFLIGLGAIYMVWSRGVVGGLYNQIASSFNAGLILIAAAMTVKFALSGNFTLHQRWAFRCFLFMSGVWFFRIGFSLYIFLNDFSAPGSTEDLTGPFDRFLAYGQTLVPLLFLELYFYTRAKASSLGRFIMAGLLATLSILTGIGIFMAAMIFWLPML